MENKKNGKNIIKKIGIGLLSLLIILIAAVGIIFVFDKIKDNEEWNKLEEGGYTNLISVGEHKLNVCIKGNENAKHTVVSVQGLSAMSNAVDLEPLIDRMGENCKFAIVDRSGYGMSEDTKEEQTVEQIVSDYRTVLQNAGIKAPYTLMAHSFGGVYSSYWQQKYPDEIEAVIYIDPTQIGSYELIKEEMGERKATSDMYISVIGCKIGLDRLLFDPAQYVSISLTEKQKEYSRMIWRNCPISWAACSEENNYIENIRKTVTILEPNDIPKLYIDATAYTYEDQKEKIEYHNKTLQAAGITQGIISELEINDLFSEIGAKMFYEENIKPYIEKLGNVKYINISGDHYIFLHKPDDVAGAINEFLDEIEKKE